MRLTCLPLTARLTVLAALLALLPPPAEASGGPRVVVSFSILSDMVREVGGERVTIDTLVGPGADAHVFEPAPRHAAMVGGADLLVVNGLGFEGWTERLVEAAGFAGPVVVATTGITPLPSGAPGRKEDEHGSGHAHAHEEGGHGAHGHHDEEAGSGHAHGDADPHAWQDLKNARSYVANIADGLCGIDADGCPGYRENAARYLEQIEALDAEIRTMLAAVPQERRKVITSHDAFGYFARAYGLEMLAPLSSSGADPSARNVAALIGRIREHGVSALFVETIADPRLMAQIARETGATIGGELYSDSLSAQGGPAASYLDMMRHNARAIAAALGS